MGVSFTVTHPAKCQHPAANLSPGNGNAFLTNRRKSRSHRVCRHHGRLNTGGRNADSVLATHSLSRINGEAVCFSTLKPVPKWFRNRLKVGLIRTQAGTRTLPFAIRVLFPPYIQPSRQPSTVLQPSEHKYCAGYYIQDQIF